MLRRSVPANRFIFGRRRVAPGTLARPESSFAGEMRLFGLTFAGGFLFMSIYLG